METSNVLSDEKSLENFARLLYVLSKRDNFIMFVMAKDGLRSSLSTPERLGLTKKQYYSRLNELLHAGLITSGQSITKTYGTGNGSIYFHTTLGKIVFYNHVAPMIQEVKNAKTLLMVDFLKGTRKFTDSDIESFVSPILEKLNMSLNPATDKLARIRVLLTEADLATSLTKIIQQAQREIFIATRTYVKSVMQPILRRAVAGIKVRILTDTDLDAYLGDKMKNMILDDFKETNEPDALKYIQIQENVTTRRTKVPFEILLLDDKFLVIGLNDRRNIEKFNAAIIIEDTSISRALADYFSELWSKSEEKVGISPAHSAERTAL
jgi:hypothetical protein